MASTIRYVKVTSLPDLQEQLTELLATMAADGWYITSLSPVRLESRRDIVDRLCLKFVRARAAHLVQTPLVIVKTPDRLMDLEDQINDIVAAVEKRHTQHSLIGEPLVAPIKAGSQDVRDCLVLIFGSDPVADVLDLRGRLYNKGLAAAISAGLTSNTATAWYFDVALGGSAVYHGVNATLSALSLVNTNIRAHANSYVLPEKASLTSGDLTITAATYGAAGNDISFALEIPTAPSATLAVSVAGQVVTVSAATDSTGAVSSTLEDIVAAINDPTNAAWNATAAALISASTGDPSADAAEVAETALSGGADVALATTLAALADGEAVHADVAVILDGLSAARYFFFREIDDTGAPDIEAIEAALESLESETFVGFIAGRLSVSRSGSTYTGADASTALHALYAGQFHLRGSQA